MKKIINSNVDKNGDFILRWKLDANRKKTKKSKDPFKDFTKDLLKELFDIAMPTYKGEDVKVDGFRFINSMEVHPLYKNG